MDIIKLKKKDIDLICLLDSNSRRNLSDLSKNLKISNQACNQKLKKLKNARIIKLITIIDYYKLGKNNIHIYYKLKGISDKERQKIINTLVSKNQIYWVVEFFGEKDLAISIIYTSIKELQEIINFIYDLMEEHILIEEKIQIVKQHILNFCVNNTDFREITTLEATNKKMNVTVLEQKIIKNIGKNARINYKKLSDDLNKNSKTITKCIKNLEKKQIIKKYKLLIDYNKLNYVWSLCYFKKEKKEKNNGLIKNLSLNKKIVFISETLEGNYILDIVSSDYSELKKTIEDIKIGNKNITDFSILNVDKIHKIKETNE